MVKITVTSDLHGHLPQTKGGDILIVAGDLTAYDYPMEYDVFFDWITSQKYENYLVIAGNHDVFLQKIGPFLSTSCPNFHYLKDSGIEISGIKFWGTPHSLWFDGINPHWEAFTGSERELEKHFSKIPQNTDVLISHGPMAACLDRTYFGLCVGSNALRDAVERVRPKVLICGHIHEAYGSKLYKHNGSNTMCYNVSHMNENYEPVNAPVDFEI